MVERTINHLISRMGRKGSDLKDIIFLSLALKWVQLPESSPGRTYELHSTINKTMAACIEQLLQPELTNNKGECQDNTEPLAKRVRTSARCMSQTTMDANPITPRQTPNPLPSRHLAPVRVSEDAEQWLNDFPGLAAEFTDFQAELYNLNDIFNGSMAQDWNWEHFWQ
jgi:hypothetical protein